MGSMCKSTRFNFSMRHTSALWSMPLLHRRGMHMQQPVFVTRGVEQ